LEKSNAKNSAPFSPPPSPPGRVVRKTFMFGGIASPPFLLFLSLLPLPGTPTLRCAPDKLRKCGPQGFPPSVHRISAHRQNAIRRLLDSPRLLPTVVGHPPSPSPPPPPLPRRRKTDSHMNFGRTDGSLLSVIIDVLPHFSHSFFFGSHRLAQGGWYPPLLRFGLQFLSHELSLSLFFFFPLKPLGQIYVLSSSLANENAIPGHFADGFFSPFF